MAFDLQRHNAVMADLIIMYLIIDKRPHVIIVPLFTRPQRNQSQHTVIGRRIRHRADIIKKQALAVRRKNMSAEIQRSLTAQKDKKRRCHLRRRQILYIAYGYAHNSAARHAYHRVYKI